MSKMSLSARSCWGHHFSVHEIRTKVLEWLLYTYSVIYMVENIQRIRK